MPRDLSREWQTSKLISQSDCFWIASDSEMYLSNSTKITTTTETAIILGGSGDNNDDL